MTARRLLVVTRFVLDDESTQKENRDFEQSVHDQLQNDQDPAGASVAVEERMNGFELIMRDADPDERVELGGGVVRELLEIGQLAPEQGFAFGRRVDDFPGLGILQGRAGQIADASLGLLDDVDDLDRQIGGKKRTLADGVHSVPEGVAVMQDLLGVRRGIGAVALCGEAAEEFVVGGENVFDLGAELRFLEREGVEQNGGVRNAVGAPFQFGQSATRASGGFKDARGFEFGLGRQLRELIERLIGAERHAVYTLGGLNV